MRDDLQIDARIRRDGPAPPRRRRRDRLLDVDVFEGQFEGIGVDRGEIENVVDDREQRRDECMTRSAYSRCFALSGPAEPSVEQLGEADDVGERRAQLIGDVVDEIVAELFRVDQRLVALGQRAFDRDGGGHVGEGQ